MQCPSPNRIVTWGTGELVREVCGCGECPLPDPSPSELRRRLDAYLLAPLEE